MNNHLRALQHIQSTANVLKRDLPRHVDLEDLIGAGCLGYVEALQKHNPALGSIEVFASKRIRGAMQDYIRGLAWSKRAKDRVYLRQWNQEATEYHSTLFSIPKDHETADAISVALSSLEDNEKQFIVELYWNGKTLAALAVEHGYSKVAAWKRHKKLLRTMRRALTKEQQECQK